MKAPHEPFSNDPSFSDSSEGIDPLWATVANEQSAIPIDSDRVVSLVCYVLQAEGREVGGVEIAFVDDATIAQLHEEFLDVPGATDEITFPLEDADDPLHTLGEVVVSTETALRQAPEFGLTQGDEALLYVVHGVLHLLGYDDHDPKEQAEMDERQLLLLKQWKEQHDG